MPHRTMSARARLITAVLLGSAASLLLAGPLAAQNAPRAMPDWSGVWTSDQGLNIDPSTKSGQPQPNAPLNAEWAQRYRDTLQARVLGKPIQDLGCLPEGPPRISRAGYPLEIVITSKQTWLFHEFKHEVRRIYTDGRKVPADVDPSYEGYSTGRWEGDTLVFDTVALKAGTLDSGGLAHSDALTLHERLRRVDADTLQDQITMTDPRMFTKPWTVTREYKIKKDWEIKEFICEENDRNPIQADGKTGFVPQGKTQ